MSRSRIGSAAGRFSTVTSEGGLLSADLLARISDNDPGIGGLTPQSYHLASGERLGEMATRSWNRLVAAWKTYQEALAAISPDHTGTTQTRERWLLVLFSELGFGRLQPSGAITVFEKSYPVSHQWGALPIHLVGARVSLDRHTPGVKGAAGASPHSLVQELVNRSDAHLWGIVSNGMRLRLLRDNASLVRSAYVEFDLESMMANEIFSDFALMWLVCHESRFEGPDPASWWIERWRTEGVATGTRALDDLRNGVKAAITALGTGFLAHRSNTVVRERLRSGELSPLDYYREILRLVYRLIFCFVAEDRNLLHYPSATERARSHYDLYYSTRHLRDVAARNRGGAHGDLYKSLLVVFSGLGRGEEALGLPALGSYLFSERSCPDLDAADIANSDLLSTLRHLAFTQAGSVLSPIDYRNLGPEELGSVYESLLELHPEVDTQAAQFKLETLAGNERKTTGSYYTPASLVTALLDSALDSVLAEAARSKDPEGAILSLRVLDPACGSGHFLIAAAHRIAVKLACVRTGEDEPAPEPLRHALRDVIGRCIHGIDVNPMAVELCKVNLWIEALEPGKPLSFLEHRIACGNALVGTTPALIDDGIPDDAFKALTDDDKKTVNSLKRHNDEQRSGAQQLLAFYSTGDPYAPLAHAVEELDSLPDENVRDIAEKERRYAELVKSQDALHAQLIADAYCAAFVIEKVRGAPRLTQGVLEQLKSNPAAVPEEALDAIERLRKEYRFLHWHLAFPHVFRAPIASAAGGEPDNPAAGWSGGFDVVLGNPPWEKLKLSEKEFFAARAPEIANAPGARRKALIAGLRVTDPDLHRAYLDALRKAEATSHLIRDSGRYPLCGRGDVNTYAVFAEAMRDAISATGSMGMVVPTGIATDDTTKEFFGAVAENELVSLYDFENRKGLFPDVDSRQKFCLLTLVGASRPSTGGAEFAFFCHSVADLDEDDRRFHLSAEEIALLNPNTRTCPVFRTRRDAEITLDIYRRVPVLIREDDPEGNPWGVRLTTMFHMTNDSALFRTRGELENRGFVLDGNVFRKGDEAYLPLYEGKMVHHFDHRAADVVISPTATARQRQPRYLTFEEHCDPDRPAYPNAWVNQTEVDARLGDSPHPWLLGFCDITSATNERTVIPAVIPKVAVGNKLPLLLAAIDPPRLALLGTSLSSFALDFAARQKVGGANLNFFIVQQLPVLPPETYDQAAPWDPGLTLADWLVRRVLELTYTASDLTGFARDLGYDGPPFRFDAERRVLLRAELDACFFHLYGIEREDVEYIMGTFPIVKQHDEDAYGEYRTARLILECYDAMAKAIASGEPYTSEMRPPPGDPLAGHQIARQGDDHHGK
ncbi:MAG: Eco57I restriction-modification methylase domain-containing protein [Acidimicrobiales bacterium]